MVHVGIIPAQWQSVVDELHESQQRVKTLEDVRDKLLPKIEELQDLLMVAGKAASRLARIDEEFEKLGIEGATPLIKAFYAVSVLRKLRQETNRLRQNCPMLTVEESLSRADAAERAARRGKLVAGGGSQAAVVAGDTQPGKPLPQE